jgi:hypothetical protein
LFFSSGKTSISVPLPPSFLYCCLAEEKHREIEVALAKNLS